MNKELGMISINKKWACTINLVKLSRVEYTIVPHINLCTHLTSSQLAPHNQGDVIRSMMIGSYSHSYMCLTAPDVVVTYAGPTMGCIKSHGGGPTQS